MDKMDGKFVYLDGLNISCVWMIEGIISVLLDDDVCLMVLKKMLKVYCEVGFFVVFDDMYYMGSYWFGSFVSYLEI